MWTLQATLFIDLPLKLTLASDSVSLVVDSMPASLVPSVTFLSVKRSSGQPITAHPPLVLPYLIFWLTLKLMSPYVSVAGLTLLIIATTSVFELSLLLGVMTRMTSLSKEICNRALCGLSIQCCSCLTAARKTNHNLVIVAELCVLFPLTKSGKCCV